MKGKLNLKGKDSKKKKIEIGIEKYFKKKIKILCIDLKHFKVNLSSINNNISILSIAFIIVNL